MSTALNGRKVLILTSNFGTEADELQRPLDALREAGAEVTVAAPKQGAVTTMKADKEFGPEVPVDATTDSVNASDFDAIVLPGGTINGDTVRTDETAQSLVRSFASDGKPVAAICHAPWLLVDTGLVEGRDVTSVPTIRTDLVNAGGNWSDQEVVVDESKGFRLITSRTPDDLDAFNKAIVDALS
ncbi:type 1 glutamine amidotransferase domain-containing protein [Brachybacterium sp. GCM10030267]|uniref:type 1 glutamine amidotransferase domain-containing protein n=1 Tax=unclassified Brachybacterium TaxID=2623841 RepID=UPI00362420D8